MTKRENREIDEFDFLFKKLIDLAKLKNFDAREIARDFRLTKKEIKLFLRHLNRNL